MFQNTSQVKHRYQEKKREFESRQTTKITKKTRWDRAIHATRTGLKMVKPLATGSRKNGIMRTVRSVEMAALPRAAIMEAVPAAT